MLARQDVINDIRKNYGNMLNVGQVAKVFNCNRKTVPKFVEGLPYCKIGKEKKYMAIDIGRLIFNQLEMSDLS